MPADILAVVSRGGRVDLARDYLSQVKAATLLIVGQLDYEVITLNEAAYEELMCIKKIHIVPKSTHLFEYDFADGCRFFEGDESFILSYHFLSNKPFFVH